MSFMSFFYSLYTWTAARSLTRRGMTQTKPNNPKIMFYSTSYLAMEQEVVNGFPTLEPLYNNDFRFLKLSKVRILLEAADQVKKAILKGALLCQIHLKGKGVLSWGIKTLKNNLISNYPRLEGSQQNLSTVLFKFIALINILAFVVSYSFRFMVLLHFCVPGVILQGTQLYDPKAGGWRDVMQVRPNFFSEK